MNLKDYLKNHEIDEELTYTRAGEVCTANPRKDCSISGTVDEVKELYKVSGVYYFYGQISAMLLECRNELENNLSSQKETLNEALINRKSSVFLTQEIELKRLGARCTDKVLENLVNTDPKVVAIRSEIKNLSNIKSQIIKVEGAENKLKIIKKALELKQEALIEISRRRKKEEINLAHLHNNNN
jgi:hypothetical protein